MGKRDQRAAPLVAIDQLRSLAWLVCCARVQLSPVWLTAPNWLCVDSRAPWLGCPQAELRITPRKGPIRAVETTYTQPIGVDSASSRLQTAVTTISSKAQQQQQQQQQLLLPLLLLILLLILLHKSREWPGPREAASRDRRNRICYGLARWEGNKTELTGTEPNRSELNATQRN